MSIREIRGNSFAFFATLREIFVSLSRRIICRLKENEMRSTRFLTLIAIFVALFASCGNLSKEDISKFKELKTLEGHSDYVTSVCWSTDGKYLASGSSDNTLIIWDANSGQKLKTLEGHSYSVSSVSWSPDGRYFASESADESIIIWDTESGQRLKTLKGHSSGVLSVSWSPDGKYLASGSGDKTVKIWGVE